MNQTNAHEQHSQQKWEQPVDIPVGEILRRARAHYGLSLPDVEQALRIRASQLEALEMMDMSRLPGRVYAIGFVRSYSEFLGLDGGRMVHLFKTQVMDGGSRPTAMNFPVSASESKIPNLYILGGSFVALVMIMTGVFFVAKGDSSSVEGDIPSISVASGLIDDVHISFEDNQPLQGAIMAAIEPAAGLEKTSQGSAAIHVDTIVINITDTSWVEIRDGAGKTLTSRVFQAGDRYIVPEEGADKLVLSTGNAGGLLFVVNGEELPKLGEKGDVLRHIDLEPEALLDRTSFAALDSSEDAISDELPE